MGGGRQIAAAARGHDKDKGCRFLALWPCRAARVTKSMARLDHLHPKAHVHLIVECLVERQISKDVEANHVHLM